MANVQKLLKISPDKLKAFNSILLDPNSQIMKDFLAVVAKSTHLKRSTKNTVAELRRLIGIFTTSTSLVAEHLDWAHPIQS